MSGTNCASRAVSADTFRSISSWWRCDAISQNPPCSSTPAFVSHCFPGVAAVRRSLLLWHRLQEHGGVHDSHAERLLAREPRIDTLVLECTNLPPYAPALRAATGLPVLDVVTLLNTRMAAL